MNQNEKELCYLPTRWSIKIKGSKFKNLILQRLREIGRLLSVEKYFCVKRSTLTVNDVL